MGAEPRKERAADFFDTAVSEETRKKLWSTAYRAARGSNDFYDGLVLQACEGADVLEYGCGTGSRAFQMAERGAASVIGIDISPRSIQVASERARHEGHERVGFRVMDAEELQFPARSFDLVCGSGILHYLDLSRAFEEIGRVLRPDGRAVFIEPLGHNPLINLYRRRTPELRTGDEHPLLMSDLTRAERYFDSVNARFFHLSTMLAIPFRQRGSFPRLARFLNRADQTLFRVLPATRRFAWQVVLELRGPRSEAPA